MNISMHTFYQRLILYVLLVLLGTSLTHKAQAQSPAIQWQKLLGGSDYDNLSVIKQTPDGGYILGGHTFSSNSGDIGTNHGALDIWVVKLDASGSVQWQKLFGGDGYETFADIQLTKDGGYIFVGETTSSNSGDVGTKNDGGYSDIWVVKLNASGAIQWQKLFGGSINESATSVQQTTDGGYIVGGYTYSSNSGDVGLNHGSYDTWVIKLDASGIKQWQQTLGGTQDDIVNSIQQTSDGGYILGGSTTSSNSGDVGVNHGKTDAWIVKLNASGAIQWQKTLGGSESDDASSIQKTSDGGYIVLGSTLSSNSGDVGANHGGSDIWVVKLTALGVIQWQKLLGGEGNENGKGIQQTSDSGYILNGLTGGWVNASGDITASHGGSDIWVVKLTTSGAIQWRKMLGGNKEDFYGSLIQTTDGGYMMLGTTDSSNSGDVVGINHGAYDGWLVKLYPLCNFTPSVSGVNGACFGEKITLKGSATTGSVQWSSVNPDIATVSQSGIVTGTGIGTTDINYTVKEGTCGVSVLKSVMFSSVLAIDVTVLGGTKNGTGTIVINNLPTGASSAIDNGAFTVGKSTYADLPIGIYIVKIQSNGCISEKEVNLAPNPCMTNVAPPKLINCPSSITVQKTSSCTAVSWTPPTVTDNCYTPILTMTTSPAVINGCFDVGKTTITYTAQSDAAKTRTATCSFDVIVKPSCINETVPPVLNFCPNNRTVETATGTTCATATWSTPDVTDNCTAPTLSLISSPTTDLKSGSCFPIGTTTMTYTATRANNLKTTCLFTVTVKAVATPQTDACANDVTPPLFANCPTDISASGFLSAPNVGWTEPTVSDNCVTPKVTLTTFPYIGDRDLNGRVFGRLTTTTITYTATDAKGLTAKCSFKISVGGTKTGSCPNIRDNFIYCPTNRLVEIPSPTCAVVNWVEPEKPANKCYATPIDFVTSPTPNLQNGSCFPIGTTAVSYSVTAGGASCRFLVTVKATSTACNLTPSVSGSSSINIGATTSLIGSATTGTAVWKSSDSTIATVSATGVVKGLKTGLVVIVYRVTEGTCTQIASKTITVGTPPSNFDATKCYQLIARHSGKVAEIAEHSVLNGVNIQQGTWGYSRRQVWRIKSIDGTYYQIMNGYSGEVMDVKGNYLYSGANIQQGVKNGGDNQKWRFDKNTEGYYFITAKHSGMVVDVKGVSTADGANIQQSTKNGGQNQQWTVAQIGCPTGTVASQSAQIYSADGYRNGHKGILTWVSNAANADYFSVEKQNKNGDFETLENVNAKSTTTYSDKNYYSYTDNQAVEGENIYRIGLVADNAPPQYSPLISLNFKAAMDFSIYPNPTSDYVDVDLTTYENRPVTLTLVDASGHEMQRLSVEKAGKTQRIVLDDLTNGLYLVRIQTVGKRDVTRVFNLTK